jgi:hypothetical protein
MYPHCDSNVLHAPGECEYCDQHPDLQIQRGFSGINFTGHYDDEKELCPAERVRPLETIEKWHGNIAMTAEQQAIDEAYWADFERQLSIESGRTKPAPAWHTSPVNWSKFYELPAWRRPLYLFEALVLRRP